MNNPNKLFQAYAATDYVVFGPAGDVTIRVGERSAAVDRLLCRYRARTATFVTAWNPYSKVVGRLANGAADRQLESWLNRRRLARVAGEGRGTVGDWPPEKSALILGLSRRQACALGRAFGQNAVVFVAFRRPAELIVLR